MVPYTGGRRGRRLRGPRPVGFRGILTLTAAGDEPAFPLGEGGLIRLRLDLAYDGTDFSGWATQPGLRTVQGTIEAALGKILRLEQPPRTTVAGRTDAGVHARGQVCHVDIPVAVWRRVNGRSTRPPTAAVARRLAAVLPLDLRVCSVAEVPEVFDARFSAVGRHYVYRVVDTPYGVDPLLRRHVLWYERSLDLGRLNTAAAGLLGEHDFAAYCRRREGATTIRTLRELRWQRTPAGVLEANVCADAFCHHMVRSLVGALLAVGDGRRAVEWPWRVLTAGLRDSAVTVAPARGLTLERVDYPPVDQLGARASTARGRRRLSASDPGD